MLNPWEIYMGLYILVLAVVDVVLLLILRREKQEDRR